VDCSFWSNPFYTHKTIAKHFGFLSIKQWGKNKVIQNFQIWSAIDLVVVVLFGCIYFDPLLVFIPFSWVVMVSPRWFIQNKMKMVIKGKLLQF
jgi:hypothetical protein